MRRIGSKATLITGQPLPCNIIEGIDWGNDGGFCEADIETAGAVEIVKDGYEGGENQSEGAGYSHGISQYCSFHACNMYNLSNHHRLWKIYLSVDKMMNAGCTLKGCLERMVIS